MVRVKTNVIANLIGQGWTALLQIALVPFYLHFLGVESYALIGFYVMLITSVQIFDLGLAQTLNREMARLSIDPQGASEMRDLVRTMEVVYWGVVIAVCAVLALLMHLIARHVLNPNQIDPDSLRQVLYMMVIVIMLNWPANLYFSGLMGLQKQVLVNKLRILLSTANGLGALLVLWLVSPTILAFFSWQIMAGLLALIVMVAALRTGLPAASGHPRFRPELLSRVWRFAAGVSGLTISGLVLTQLDKWILINFLTLEAFGYFSLAVTVAGALNLFATPVFSAVYPRFSVLIAEGKHAVLEQVYHISTQVVAATVVPAALFLSFYSHEVLLLWTRNENVASHAGPILSLFAIGTALNGLMNVPYARELARGRTRIFLIFNLAAIAVLGPAIWYLAPRIGAISSAIAWITLNAAYLIIEIPLVHSDMRRGEQLRWYLRDIMAPAVAAIFVLGAGRILLPEGLHPIGLLAALAVILGLAVAAAGLAAPELRNTIKASALKWLGRTDTAD
ncbi:MAG: oligosaccharide flippase family protein [Burkholderiales bacterium]|nr:oligosaccharide flippase family protein [Burkholderiales bacterium]